MVTAKHDGGTANEWPKEYDQIETTLASIVDKLCMLEHLADFESELGEIQAQLSLVENSARRIDNDRLASLARAVQILLSQITRAPQKEIRPDTYAFLIYSVRTISRLTGVSKYVLQTGMEIPDASFSEAIGAIIDHTEELSHPAAES